jgi:hypothetical protein
MVMMDMLDVILGLIMSLIMSLVVSWIVRLVSMIYDRLGKRLISFQLIFFDGIDWR